MKCLLRTYEGIYDNRVSINEKQIAKLCKLPYEKIYIDLQQLHAVGIIEYLPQKDTPQIHFLLNRAPAKTMHINQDAYFQRKKQYNDRIEIMIQYLQSEIICRSKYIANYFTATENKDCGICDNCLKQKKVSLSVNEFSNIEKTIFKLLDSRDISMKELLQNLKDVDASQLWNVIQLLQDEKKIFIDNCNIIKKVTA